MLARAVDISLSLTTEMARHGCTTASASAPYDSPGTPGGKCPLHSAAFLSESWDQAEGRSFAQDVTTKIIEFRGPVNQAAFLKISKSLRLASFVAALSVQSKSSVQPFLVLCGPCGLPALT